MDEQINENNVKNSNNNIDKDTINLTSNSLKNENSMDLNSIMQLATTLLKNDTLMNTVTGISKNKQSSTAPVTKVPEKQENTELVSLYQKLEKIDNVISAMQQENTGLSQKLEKIDNEVSDIKQENIILASLSIILVNIEFEISELRKEIQDLKRT
ncbi:hypothetical protein Q8G35_22450 [Peribacillus simplex]|uniref:Uncharacterized protein n=2 Tax=Peribacillus TaxID=2675229 RepID=A0AA90PDC3_9BACI|nr:MULTISPECIES: hypothetical protein [Peribacillus]MDP1421062.1 hypothetical protein [Peribacillus simplex]MDP1453829.1 hypothetical protein [Peribacillus frigoritolerans]